MLAAALCKQWGCMRAAGSKTFEILSLGCVTHFNNCMDVEKADSCHFLRESRFDSGLKKMELTQQQST